MPDPTVLDGFAGTTGANLTARDGLVGATWSKVNGTTADIVLSIANRARGNANALARYVASGVPGTTDYAVTGRLHRMDGRGEMGVMARAATNADTAYVWGYVHTAGQWQLRRVVGGSGTTLGTFAETLADGDDRRFTLLAYSTGTSVELRGFVEGVLRVSTSDTNASRITAAGRVGIRTNMTTGNLTNTRGYHLSWIAMFEMASDGRTRGARPGDGVVMAEIRTHAQEEWPARKAAALAALAVPADWQVTVGATTYTLGLPRGMSTSGPMLVVPEIACSPAPPTPLDPNGYRFVNPPLRAFTLGTVRAELGSGGLEPCWEENDREDLTGALRQMVADCVLRGA